jgi:hypothetical protein
MKALAYRPHFRLWVTHSVTFSAGLKINLVRAEKMERGTMALPGTGFIEVCNVLKGWRRTVDSQPRE